ncbi:unnamed protein product [Zymoseptoria tritici ST99CH_1E4]|uniref:Uncharacterized protein n=1 Tax=Zymoseptoria tritici ST99CH_1E4 TaxID=1276532 RepID=A0A2H1GFN7_ZYMTR|nr:unnamed protein product [Zymoseptoria tritici ST99CH_1E4]
MSNGKDFAILLCRSGLATLRILEITLRARSARFESRDYFSSMSPYNSANGHIAVSQQNQRKPIKAGVRWVVMAIV